MVIYKYSIRRAIHFWHISRENYKIMTGLYFHDGAGLVAYMCLSLQRRALRVTPAETWLTVYRRRFVSDLDGFFPFIFGVFLTVANLFWL